MAKLEQVSTSGNEVYLMLGSLAILVSMVVAVLGIKFRWFKHRLSFEPIPSSEVTGIGSVGSYRSSIDQSQLTQGVFRRRNEDDNVIERPISLPPIRVRKTSREPPPPLLPQKRAIAPMPPGQELIPETPQIDPKTPPALFPRTKRDKSPQRSPGLQIHEPLYEVKEETCEKNVEQTNLENEEIVQEEIGSSSRISLDSLEVEKPYATAASLISLDDIAHTESHVKDIAVEKPVKQRRTSSLLSFENPTTKEEDDLLSKSLPNEDTITTDKLMTESNSTSTSLQSFDNLTYSSEQESENSHKQITEQDKIELTSENPKTWEIVITDEHNLEESQDFSKIETALIKESNNEKSVHFEIEEVQEKSKKSFIRRDTGITKHNVQFELYENYFEKELKDVTEPDSPEDWEIIQSNDEEVLEKKVIHPTPKIILTDTDESHKETDIVLLSDVNNVKPKVVPAPRKSKETITPVEVIIPKIITFEEEEPQQIAFTNTDDNISQDSIVIDADNKKPKIIELKERASFEEVIEKVKPVPRQRTGSGTVPPLPKSPPPTSPETNFNWTAVQVHRNFTKELNAEIMEVVLKKSVAKEVKAEEGSTESSPEDTDAPKNMRDMMKKKNDQDFSSQ